MKRPFSRWEILFVAVVFAVGTALRLHLVRFTYLNPDEVLQATIAFGPWRDMLRNSLGVTHPPLLEILTYFVSRISRTELALRTIPLVSGCLFPVLLYIWLRRLAGSIAALALLLLLTFAPHAVRLSAQLRSYTLALLFLSAALVMLEQALDSGKWPRMALYSVLLWMCILSDYSMAWFVGAAGVYALLRLRGRSGPLQATWLAGQLAALVLYGFLFKIQVQKFRGSPTETDAVTNWLHAAFPQAGHALAFPVGNTLEQFRYLFLLGRPAAILACALFAAGVGLLWAGRTEIEPGKARTLAVLLVLPFPLGIAGAYAHQFPYGASRHTIVLGVFAAIGIAIFLGTLPRRWAFPLLGGMLALAPFWSQQSDYEDITADRNQRQQILQCLEYMRIHIPSDALVFTERETLDTLSYYEGHTQLLPWPQGYYFLENSLGGRWRVASRDYAYVTQDQYAEALAAFRRQYGIGPRDPVWVLDGGWTVASGPPDPALPFSRAVRVFRSR